MILTKKQTQALDLLEDKVTNELLFGGGAGGGKSALGCYWLTKNSLKYPGSRWMMGRAVLKTLKKTTLKSFLDVARIQGLRPGVHYRYNEQKNNITFYNGSEIILQDLFLYPSDPNFDELGSLELTGAFIDECNQTVEKAWDIVKSRLRYKLDEYDLVPKILGSCNPAKNWIYQRFYKPSKEGSLNTDQAFIQSLLDDNPHISKHYRQQLLSMKDAAAKERLLYGNWEYDDDPATLMSFDKISDLFTNQFIIDLASENYITADIARYGKDKTVIGVWKGFTLIAIITIDKNKVTEAADLIRNLAAKYSVPMSNIIADDDGVGGGVVDILGCNGFVNNSSPLGNPETYSKENYANLKAQCSFMLAQKVNKNEMYVKDCPTDVKDKLTQELEQIKRKDIDKDGKLTLVPKEVVKEKLGRSPDYSDMVMMRMWFELRPVWKFYVA